MIRFIFHIIHQIDGFNLLAVNDFSVYLGRFHVGVAEQLARGIKVCAQCQHHRCEAVPRRMVGDFLGDTSRLHPLCQYLVYVWFGYQPVKHLAVIRGIATFRQPFHRL